MAQPIYGSFEIDSQNGIIIYYDLQNNQITRMAYGGDPDEILNGYTTLTGAPAKIMRWQFRAQLGLETATDNNFTTLKDQVEYIITQMTGSQKVITEEAWNSASTISRLSPTVEAIGGIVGLNDTQIDNIFISASNIAI